MMIMVQVLKKKIIMQCVLDKKQTTESDNEVSLAELNCNVQNCV